MVGVYLAFVTVIKQERVNFLQHREDVLVERIELFNSAFYREPELINGVKKIGNKTVSFHESSLIISVANLTTLFDLNILNSDKFELLFDDHKSEGNNGVMFYIDGVDPEECNFFLLTDQKGHPYVKTTYTGCWII
ncbi:hypothetical protein [Vibrio sp. D431a]|uniref:hypothetical protein n=1 Tax=Vibrio sp. D431a TaxID=2837388 RepID=UPI0025574EEA|nr:hypothetical protein [Vibrio sp. D431a]MDK9790622.1 hypothetical protein [Vibrio sp. D431a]